MSSAIPASSSTDATVVMQAVPAADLPDAIGMEVLNGTNATVTSGQMKEIEPVRGSVTQCPESRGKGLIVESSGTYYKIKFKTHDQEKQHEQLHNAIVKDARDRFPGSTLTINVSRGWIEADGHIVEFLHNTGKAGLLTDMRILYHDALGQSYSDIVWHDFLPNDRASTSDPLPSQQRQNVDALKNLKDYSPEGISEVAELKEFHFTRKLHKGIIDLIDKQRETIGTTTEAQSRKAQLTRVKEKYEKLDEWILGYHAAHPLPNLSNFSIGSPQRGQKMYDAIVEYRDSAKAYLTEAVKENDSLVRAATELSFRKDSNKPEVQEAIDKLSLEMALSACATREEYELMCLAFETKPCRTSPELFLMRLSHVAATGGNVNQLIDEQFDVAFQGLIYKEDQLAIHDGLGPLINGIQTELSDGRLNDATTYNARIEQMEMVKKQGILANAQKGLAEKLDALNLSNAAANAHVLAADLETLKADLNGVQPTLEAYKPFAERMQGLAQRQEELLKQLDPNRADLRSVINRQRGIQQHQAALGTFVSDKVDSKSTIKRGLNKIRHGVIPLSQIGAHLE